MGLLRFAATADADMSPSGAWPANGGPCAGKCWLWLAKWVVTKPACGS